MKRLAKRFSIVLVDMHKYGLLTGIYVATWALSCSPSQAAQADWTCENISTADTVKRIKEIDTMCTGLNDSDRFWQFGFAGHFKKLPNKVVEMKRVICTSDGRHAVGALENGRELALFCLNPEARGQGTNSLDALNTILKVTKANNPHWLSSNDPNTQNFYKSLDIDCACESIGPAGKDSGLAMMFSTNTMPIEKKTKHYSANQQGELNRIVFDSCMTSDEFHDLSGKLYEAALAEDKQDHHKETNILIPFSALATPLRLDKAWLKQHPTQCQ